MDETALQRSSPSSSRNSSPSSSRTRSFSINPLSKYFCISQRYIVYILSALAIGIAYCLRISVEVAVVSKNLSSKNESKDYTCSSDREIIMQTHIYKNKLHHNWTIGETKLFFSSFYLGYVVMQVPAGYLADKYGGKHILTLSLFGSSICNFITVGVLESSVKRIENIIWVRIFNGLLQGGVYPCVTSILVHWSPIKDRATIAAFVYSAAALGYIIARSLGAYIIYATASWKSIFFFCGSLGLIWCVNWIIFGYHTPETNPFINPEEKHILAEDLDDHLTKTAKVVPYKSIIKSGPVWALILAELGHDWGWFTVTHHLSEYLNQVLKLDVIHDEYWSGIPFAFVWMMSLIFGCLSDWLVYEQHVNLTSTRKLVVFVSMLGPALGIMFGSFVGCQKDQAMFIFAIAIALFGVFYPSAYANIFDLAPNFAGCIFGILNSVGAIMGILSPILVGIIARNNTLTEWQHIFWLTLLILMTAAMLYMFLGSAREQEWNKQ